MGRIRTIAVPATVDGTTGSAGSGVATYTYTDTPGAVAVREQHTLSRSGTNTSVTKVFDGLGRVVNVSKAVPISECGMGAVQVNTSYDTMGRAYTVTNPYCATSDSTYGSSQYNYDYFGRKILQTQPDASSLQWCYDGSQNPSGGASCSSNRSSITPATWVDSFDETGRHWQHVSDGLGRLAAAIEPNPSNGSLALETDYTYDALSNLLSVTQKGLSTDTPRVRNFTYDAMSHLLCASNPENSSSACPSSATATMPNGVVSYTDDLNGNLLTKTSPLANATSGMQTVHYSYDALNRLVPKGSSGAAGRLRT